MTDEQIKAIRMAQRELRALRKRNEEAESEWEKEHLDPLEQTCDHTYPWGDSAIQSNSSYFGAGCAICGYQKL